MLPGLILDPPTYLHDCKKVFVLASVSVATSVNNQDEYSYMPVSLQSYTDVSMATHSNVTTIIH